jgi:DNA uptake protein ComE-like DNA-binding protein
MRLMWKDFFYYSKGQRIGIVTLIVLIVLALVLNYLLPLYFPVKEHMNDEFLSEVKNFKKSLVSRDSLRQLAWQQKMNERQRLYEEEYNENYPTYTYKNNYEKKKSYTLFNFDPNGIDSVGLIQLGLKPFVASNILKYRKKGGVFRTAADFAKVFGVLPEKFKELELYITIAEIKAVKNEPLVSKRTDLIVELNSSDTTLLMQVKGIGRGYAKGIVRFRQSTGGFVSIDQLSEIYGMKPEVLEKIRPFCTVNPALVQKIKVNIASVERLKSHPYIGFYRAKAIYELRRNRGKLHDISELRILQELTSEDLNRLKSYLSFD